MLSKEEAVTFMEITSLENKSVKLAASLQKKKYRDLHGKFLIEGMKLIREAMAFGYEFDSVFYVPDKVAYDLDLPAYEVSYEILCKITDTVTPQGIAAIVKGKEPDFVKLQKAQRVVYLDRVQDPGNVGTIIRTADAFGFDAVILSKECADLYSPKVLRSAMGSVFHLEIYRDFSAEDLKKLGKKIYSSSLEASNMPEKIALPAVLVIGNEGQGISEEIKAVTDEFVKIPMAGNAESLNASIAAGILLYEFRLKY